MSENEPVKPEKPKTFLGRLLRWRYPLIALLILGFGLYWLTSDVNQALEHREQNVEQLKMDLAKKRQLAETLPAQREEFAKIKAELEQLTNQLPEDPDLEAMTETLIQAAAETGVELVSIAPQPPRFFDFYEQQSVRLVLNGGYVQLKELVERMADDPRIYRWESLVMEPLDEAGLARPGPDNETFILLLSGELVTYGILDEQEQAALADGDRPSRESRK